MSSNKNSYPIPDGYKEIEFQTEHHIDHIGKGFHKKDAEGNLVMAFYCLLYTSPSPRDQ